MKILKSILIIETIILMIGMPFCIHESKRSVEEVSAFLAENEAYRAEVDSHLEAIDEWLIDCGCHEEAEPVLDPVGTFRVTGYVPDCPHCCGKTDGITASGRQATIGVTVAADTAVLPLGSQIYIEGLGDYVVEDTGSAVIGNIIDVACSTHDECYALTGYYEVYYLD